MKINLITNLTGFPYGTATANRIEMIGRALIEAKVDFIVYTNGLRNEKYNNKVTGTYKGIRYKYLHGTVKLNVSKQKKIYLYIKGIIALNYILKKKNNEENIIYIYAFSNLFNIVTIILCKCYKLKVVQEINEWFHNDENKYFEKLVAEGPMIKAVEGAVVISKNIQSNVLRINPEMATLLVPILEDPLKFKNRDYKGEKYCLWMGLVDGYLKDILFIIKSCGLAVQKGLIFNLIICGPISSSSIDKIYIAANAAKLSLKNLNILGYVNESEINSLCQNAFFHIVPLWIDNKSQSRFPTKIASFMFCGNPVITCQIGEVGEMLTDNENVLFFKPNNNEDLTNKILLLFENNILYSKLSTNSRSFALEKFNYLKYAKKLEVFFKNILNPKSIN